eukprot:2793163-Rhodomonas_salina.1
MMQSALIKGMKLVNPLGPGARRNSLLTLGEEPSRSGPTGISAATSSGCMSWNGVANGGKAEGRCGVRVHSEHRQSKVSAGRSWSALRLHSLVPETHPRTSSASGRHVLG